MPEGRKTVSLVLGSGGACGLAHISIVQCVLVLERRHVLRLLGPTIGKPGLFRGERIISVLRELIGDYIIGDLPIASTAVATDMGSERRSGRARASCLI